MKEEYFCGTIYRIERNKKIALTIIVVVSFFSGSIATWYWLL